MKKIHGLQLANLEVVRMYKNGASQMEMITKYKELLRWKNAFKNKVVWITGASSGIGKELAIQLSQQQAILILTSSNASLLEEVKQEVQGCNSLCFALRFDLDNIPDLVDKAISFRRTNRLRNSKRRYQSARDRKRDLDGCL
jgi:FlaA1/EpsC-like NDP-sugar epimerase